MDLQDTIKEYVMEVILSKTYKFGNLLDNDQLDISCIHGDGSNTVVKKGGTATVIQDTNIRKVKKS